LGASAELLTDQPRDARSIERTAADMESLFASLMLKEMRQTLEPGSLFGDDASDSCGSLFDLYLGQHVAKSGGLGIADMVKRQLGRQ
jgi:flagellar protein FlgJ